jgi:beta-glucanase (GH16 family)
MIFRALLFLGLVTLQPLSAQSGWTLTWQDEFDGAALDTSKWGFDTGAWPWNAEKEFYTDRTQNVYLENGNLVIKAIRENYGGREYTSGRILSKDKFAQAYGRFEARMRVPAGQGMWPAFWMMGDNLDQVGWPTCGEIDVMENIGGEPGVAYGTIHGPGYTGIGGSYTMPGSGRLSADFHVYAIEWEPGEIRWYVDDHLYSTKKPASIPPGTNWVYNRPFYMLLNLAVGGSWPGNPDSTTAFPASLYVDYVRVYKRALVNGASFRSEVAPGSWVTIQGSALSPVTRVWAEADFQGANMPTSLDGVSVQFNGTPAYVYYVSPTQINVQAPDTRPGPLTVEVLNNGQLKTTLTANASVFAPAFFLWAGQYAVATHHDWSLAVKPGVFPLWAPANWSAAMCCILSPQPVRQPFRSTASRRNTCGAGSRRARRDCIRSR